MEMEDFSTVLVRHGSIWEPFSTVTDISYPSDGNEVCFQVEDESFWFKHRNECVLHCIGKYHDKTGYFFDIGGGNGYVASGLQEAGYKVCLVEPGTSGVLNAKERGLDNIVKSTFEDCSFITGSLSSVGLFDVLEHIEDDFQFLKNLRDKLVDGGHIFLTVPAFHFLWSGNDDIAGHYRRYTLTSLEKVLKLAGFSIVYSSYLFSWLVLPILLFRSIPSKLGIIKKTNVRKKTLKHHKARGSMVTRLLSKLSNWELDKIAAGQKITLGSSCVIVGKKFR